MGIIESTVPGAGATRVIDPCAYCGVAEGVWCVAWPDLRGQLMVALSQSGATPEIVSVCERMRASGALTVANGLFSATGGGLTNTATGTVLDTRTISSFHNGAYISWNLVGHVQLRVTLLVGVNAVVSGLFFDPTTSTRGFVVALIATAG